MKKGRKKRFLQKKKRNPNPNLSFLEFVGIIGNLCLFYFISYCAREFLGYLGNFCANKRERIQAISRGIFRELFLAKLRNSMDLPGFL